MNLCKTVVDCKNSAQALGRVPAANCADIPILVANTRRRDFGEHVAVAVGVDEFQVGLLVQGELLDLLDQPPVLALDFSGAWRCDRGTNKFNEITALSAGCVVGFWRPRILGHLMHPGGVNVASEEHDVSNIIASNMTQYPSSVLRIIIPAVATRCNSECWPKGRKNDLVSNHPPSNSSLIRPTQLIMKPPLLIMSQNLDFQVSGMEIDGPKGAYRSIVEIHFGFGIKISVFTPIHARIKYNKR